MIKFHYEKKFVKRYSSFRNDSAEAIFATCYRHLIMEKVLELLVILITLLLIYSCKKEFIELPARIFNHGEIDF